MDKTYRLNDISKEEIMRCEKEEALKMNPWEKTLERSGGWVRHVEDYYQEDEQLTWYEYPEVEEEDFTPWSSYHGPACPDRTSSYRGLVSVS